MRQRLPALFAAVAALLVLAACQPPQQAPAPAPTPLPPAATAVGPAPTVQSPPTATAAPAPTPVPPLTRQMLKNAAYPMEMAAGGVAQLADGVYRRQYLPDSATELVILLTHFVVHGDLNGDRTEDAVAVILVDPGGSGSFYYLVPVINQNGVPRPAAAQFLGDRVYIRSIRIESGVVAVELDVTGARDAACCPTDSKRSTYRLVGDKLAQIEVTDLPDPKVSARLSPPAQPVEFGPAVTSVTLQGSISFNGMNSYSVAAQARQMMTVTLTSPHDDVWLSIVGRRDSAVLTSILSETTRWSGRVPGTQEYLISAVAAGGETDYTLRIELEAVAAPAPSPQPTATLAPPTGSAPKVIHLTFDDGPTDPRWTPQVLQVLARYNARATFFVLGQLAARYPDMITAVVKAGHTLANHTYEHQTLDRIGREAFIKEVKSTEALLGDRATKCLRPPYGATDAYTRAYATELGYTLVMWDVDTRDWSRPGVAAITETALQESFPGAVVLFHDGGGDRSQTVEALEAILEGLRKKGYAFEPVCN